MPGYEDNVYVSNAANLAKYMKLDQKGKVLAEYIWIDGHNGLRNKTKVSTLFSSLPCDLCHQSTVAPTVSPIWMPWLLASTTQMRNISPNRKWYARPWQSATAGRWSPALNLRHFSQRNCSCDGILSFRLVTHADSQDSPVPFVCYQFHLLTLRV